MPWYHRQAYIEEWAADPAEPTFLIDPALLPRRVPQSSEVEDHGRVQASLDDLAGLGFTVRRKE